MSKLISFSSEYIKAYISKNPIDNMEDKAWMARIGGPGNRRTPSMGIVGFYKLLDVKEALFTQCEYHNFVFQLWEEQDKQWFSGLDTNEKEGLKVRCFRNFYISGVDQLYCQAILSETCFFNRVKYVSRMETSGVDIVAYTKTERDIKIGLSKDTAKPYEKIKEERRGTCSYADFMVYKPSLDRAKGEGNMVWYEIGDFADVMQVAIFDSRSNAKTKTFLI